MPIIYNLIFSLRGGCLCVSCIYQSELASYMAYGVFASVYTAVGIYFEQHL